MNTDEEQADYGGRLWPESQSLEPSSASNAIPHSVSWKPIAGILGVLTLAACITAIGHGVGVPQRAALPPGSAAPAGSEAEEVGGAVSPPPQELDSASEVEVYVALISDLNQRQWKRVFVSREICAQFPLGHAKCTGALTHHEQAAIEDALPSLDLSFKEPPRSIFSDYSNYGNYASVTLGPIVQSQGSIHVEAGYSCIYTCGYGTTYVLRERSGGWRVTGQVGDSWIS